MAGLCLALYIILTSLIPWDDRQTPEEIHHENQQTSSSSRRSVASPLSLPVTRKPPVAWSANSSATMRRSTRPPAKPRPRNFVLMRQGKLEINPAQQVSYTTCLGCTTMCGVRVRIDQASGKVSARQRQPVQPAVHRPASADEGQRPRQLHRHLGTQRERAWTAARPPAVAAMRWPSKSILRIVY